MHDSKHDDEARARLEAAYDKFAERVAALLVKGGERGREALEAAMESVRAGLTAAGEFSAAQGEEFKRYLRRDYHHLAEQARQRLDPERLRDGALAALATALQAGGEMLQSWSRKADAAVIYEAGELTSAGTLTCVNCGRVIHLTKTSHVPPCPECLAARFRKSY